MVTTSEPSLSAEDVLRLIQENGGPEGLDLSGSNLSGIALIGEDLHGIKLARWDDASGKLISADLSKSNLWACNFAGADLRGVNFSHANLKDADLPGANLANADFTGAILVHADLSGANMGGVTLRESNLELANLLQVDLRLAQSLENARFYRVRLDKTRVQRSQLGAMIGDELAKDYVQAIEAYRALKQNFEDLRDYDGASWAYIKERQMGKLSARKQAREARHAGNRRLAANLYAKWMSDWIVESLCNYGESVWRVIGWILGLTFVVGPLMLGISGGLNWIGNNREIYSGLTNPVQQWSYAYFQYVLYTIDTLTTASFSEMKPATDAVRLVSGLMAFTGIFLAGLLGFVAGNRIRHS